MYVQVKTNTFLSMFNQESCYFVSLSLNLIDYTFCHSFLSCMLTHYVLAVISWGCQSSHQMFSLAGHVYSNTPTVGYVVAAWLAFHPADVSLKQKSLCATGPPLTSPSQPSFLQIHHLISLPVSAESSTTSTTSVLDAPRIYISL